MSRAKGDRVRLTLRVPADVDIWLWVNAHNAGVTVNDVINDAIERYIKEVDGDPPTPYSGSK